MAFSAKAFTLPKGRWPHLIYMIVLLGGAALGSKPGFADQIDCEKVRTGTDPIRFTLRNTAETEVKKPPQLVSYSDVIRNSPEGIVLFNRVDPVKFKIMLTRSLLPLSLEVVGKGLTSKFTYDTDISTLTLKPGTSFTINAVEPMLVGGGSMNARHVYAFTDGGQFEVVGCKFPVVSVHHTIHFTREGMEWDVIVDSLTSTDLDFTLRLRREVVAGSNSRLESGIFDSVVTDLSTTADFTKDP